MPRFRKKKRSAVLLVASTPVAQVEMQNTLGAVD